MYDKESLKEQAILKFSDITKKKIEPRQESKTNSKTTIDDLKAEMESKVATAKMHANKEIDMFREATKRYINEIKDLVLFPGIDSIIDELMLDQLLDHTVSPVVKGQKLPGMTDEEYREFRTHVFKALIERYVDKS